MIIHDNTIHFDDRPWSIRGYVYDKSSTRYRFIVPEDLIFAETQRCVLSPSDMLTWVKQQKHKLEIYCSNYANNRQNLKRPLKDGDDIIIIKI